MPRLYVLQSIWGMDRVRDAADWSMSERLRMIRDAGFDGISAHFYPGAGVEAWIDQANEYDFVIEGNAFPKTVEDLAPALELAARHGIHHMAVQGDVRPYNADAAIPILQGWQRLARDYDVPVFVETHRNTISNDLWMTRELLDRVPGMPLLADLSHYVCGQEMNLPISARNEELIDRILSSTRAFHGRVSSSQQVQIEISFDCHQQWLNQFMRWWERGFQRWLARAGEADSLTFTCELGPAPYAITGRDGRDRSNRWEEAQQMRDLIRACWNELTDATAECAVVTN